MSPRSWVYVTSVLSCLAKWSIVNTPSGGFDTSSHLTFGRRGIWGGRFHCGSGVFGMRVCLSYDNRGL
ncbi:hypothetical protein BDV06DRAFT_201217 [Aspergillus oleicola]